MEISIETLNLASFDNLSIGPELPIPLAWHEITTLLSLVDILRAVLIQNLFIASLAHYGPAIGQK